MTYLQIKNWEKFQQYKDREPTWIKLHRELLNDYEFSRLPDAAKAHLMLIWLLASQMGNKLPCDARWLTQKIGATSTVDLNALIDSGYLVPYQNDTETKTIPPEVCSTKTETETQEKTEKVEESARDDFADFWSIYPKARAGSVDKARAAWMKAITRATPDTIIRGTIAYAQSDEVAKGYAKGCAAWLNDDRWTNDYTAPKGSTHATHNPRKSATDAHFDGFAQAARLGQGKRTDW
jgi:hypothetical protein